MDLPPYKVCQRCLYTSYHPLGIVLDEHGICSGCRVHEEKDVLNWDERFELLKALIKPYRTHDSRNYDCVVPVTGAGDSFYLVHLVKERLHLRPLLVTYNRYYNTPLGIRNLSQLRRRFDCDLLIQSVNPISVKKIIRTTLRTLGSFHWPVLAGQTAFPVQTAVSHGIPLVVWGAHQGLEQVGMFSHLHEVEMTRRYRKDHDLMGYEADDLLNTFDTLSEVDIWQYRYPDDSSIQNVGVRGIYLGNYFRWDPLAQHQKMVREAGFRSASTQRTFDVFDHVDDWHYMGLHDTIKQCKHGYGRVLDQICREIRHKRLSREHGQYLVSQYQNQPSTTDDIFLEWLGLDQSGLSFLIDLFTSKLRTGVTSSPTFNQHELTTFLSNFQPNDVLDRSEGKHHVTLGRGYPD